jgi:hypothetical protein
VEIDLLAPATPRVGPGRRHERIGGEPLARRTPGAELVRAGHVDREISGTLPDGRPNRVSVRVATPAALIVLKGLAMGERDKPKDAYDIDYLLRHAGVDEIASGIAAFNLVAPVGRALEVIAARFATVDTIGPTSVAVYRRAQLGSAQADGLQALAFARVRQLLDLVGQAQ